MGKKFTFILKLCFALLFINNTNKSIAQCNGTSVVNPSFEGPTGANLTPAPWVICTNTPDTQPCYGGVLSPSNGNSYIGITAYYPNGNIYESFSQQLSQNFSAGQAYTFSIDLAKWNANGYANGIGEVQIWGGFANCTKSQLLWSSGSILNYTWQPYQVAFTPNANYTHLYFEIVDFNCGCFETPYIFLDNMSQIVTLSTQIQSTTTCFGQCNATAKANVYAGTPPFNYTWSTGAITDSIGNLCAGTYWVNVSDANGCFATDTVTIGNPAINIVSNFQQPLCNGDSNGVASVIVTGGSSPYTYLWSNGSTNDTIPNLRAGTYTLTVTDSVGCTASTQIVINEPAILQLAINAVNISCFGVNDAIAIALVNGGTPPYLYLWSNGNTNDTLLNPPPGTYTLIVYDFNSCSSTAQVTIIEPPAIAVNLSIVDVSCFGGNDGSITLNTSGGTAPYNYAWTPNVGNTDIVSNLTAGNYSCTITDANGCTFTQIFYVGENPLLQLQSGQQNVNCFNGTSGIAYVTVSGGMAPYTYSWSNGSINDSIVNIPAGTYNVTVTDANGCAVATTINITEPASGITINNLIINSPLCNGAANGSISFTVTGGTSPYLYVWNPNVSNTNTANNLSAGNYSVTITDANGCNLTQQFNVVDPPAIVINSSITNARCNAQCNGTAKITAQGGTLPYSYLWSNGAITDSIFNLCAGNYSCNITDANGCTAQTTVIITEPAAMQLTINSGNSHCGNADGMAWVSNVIGGTAPYTYLWSNANTNDTAFALIAGNYTVTVTDSNNCTVQGNVTITNAPAPILNLVTQTDEICGNASGTITVNAIGTAPFNYTWNPNVSITNSANNLVAGNYTVSVTDAFGCVSNVLQVTINNQQIQITASTVVKDEKCTNAKGEATATPTNGTSPYTYSWNTVPLQTNATATQLSSGNYICTITDANGCTGTVSVTISNTDDILFVKDIVIEPEFPQAGEQTKASAVLSNDWEPYYWKVPPTNENTTEKNPTFYSIDQNSFTLILYAISSNGCIDSISKTFAVKPPITFYVPNSFTPNGDNLNETFGPELLGIKELSGAIYNRWGEIIFEYDAISDRWDGVKSEQGVYVYRFNYKDMNERSETKIGTVTLVK